jgi:hypothetical protein
MPTTGEAYAGAPFSLRIRVPVAMRDTGISLIDQAVGIPEKSATRYRADGFLFH